MSSPTYCLPLSRSRLRPPPSCLPLLLCLLFLHLLLIQQLLVYHAFLPFHLHLPALSISPFLPHSSYSSNSSYTSFFTTSLSYVTPSSSSFYTSGSSSSFSNFLSPSSSSKPYSAPGVFHCHLSHVPSYSFVLIPIQTPSLPLLFSLSTFTPPRNLDTLTINAPYHVPPLSLHHAVLYQTQGKTCLLNIRIMYTLLQR